jgi:hypothetical protein
VSLLLVRRTRVYQSPLLMRTGSLVNSNSHLLLPPSCAETRLSVRRKSCQLCHLPHLHWVESQLALSRLGVSDAPCRIHRDQHPSSKTHAANPRGPFRRQGYGVRFNGLPKLALIILSSTYLGTNRAWRREMGVAIISPHPSPSPCWLVGPTLQRTRYVR